MILALVILFMLTTKLHSLVVVASKSPGRLLSTSLKMSSTFPKRLPIIKDLKSEQQRLEESQRVSRCIQFLDSSPEPFHVVHTVIQTLSAAGFTRLDEGDLWNIDNKIKKGGKYYFTRNGSTIVAFTVGMNFVAGKSGFKVIGAHTDSPNLKLKPRTKKTANGLVQLGVESYGGGLWHTWFDRDLSIAGRVIKRTLVNGVPSYKHHLIKIDRPVLRIPNLCIHLNTPKEREAFAVNKEDHLAPILCDYVEKTMSKKDGNDTEVEEADQWGAEQTPELLSLLSEELKCQLEDIVDFELSLYDTQGAAVSGYREEFLCSSRIDNLASCFVALEALVAHSTGEEHSSVDKDGDISMSCGLDVDEDISMVAFFDHEEVGSDSNSGAGSTIMRDAVVRISNALSGTSENSELFKASLAKSLILSVDMAHAIHPNYASKHEKNHAPRMNSGIVIKTNSNQRYATNGITGFLLREIGRKAGVPMQEFAVRNDCACGSTIGPIISHNTGIRAVDIGMPQLSMHSIREMMGTSDLTFGYTLFKSFFKDFRSVDNSLADVDSN